MSYLLYLMFRCDRRCDGCDGKFGNLVGTKHTHGVLNVVGKNLITQMDCKLRDESNESN